MDGKKELSDDQLDMVAGGINTEPNYDVVRKHEIELGDFVADAYKHEQTPSVNNSGLNIL